MKLLYITNGTNGAGGLERVLSIKASLLAEEYGYDVTVMGLNNGNNKPFYKFSSKINWVNINVTGNSLCYIRQYKKEIQHIVNKLTPDVISVCDDGLKGFFVPQFIKTKAKIIYERHVSKQIETNIKQGWIKKIARRSKWFLMEMLGKKFTKFVVLTPGNENEWSTLKNLIVIANPLSFYSEKCSELTNRKVICVGKISYQKGQDLLLKSWKIVQKQYPDWSLELYGKKNLDFLDITLYRDRNVQHYQPEKNIQEKYLESSICVMSSRFEGFGMVLIEAMACGVPCISFDCPCGPADIISNGRDGFLVEQKNVTALADKLLLLITDENVRQRMGQAAKESVKRFEANRIVKQWDYLFKELVQLP